MSSGGSGIKQLDDFAAKTFGAGPIGGNLAQMADAKGQQVIIDQEAERKDRKVRGMIDNSAKIRLTTPGANQTLLTSGYGGTLLTQRK